MAILWLIICTVLLTLPGSNFPKKDWLDKIWFDKWVHIFLFSVMVFLACMFWVENGKSSVKFRLTFYAIAFSALVYGIIMELVQHYWIPNRSFEYGDIIADGVGSLLGLVIFLKWLKKKDPRRNGGHNQN